MGDSIAGGGDTGKDSSADASKTGAGERHGTRPEKRVRLAGRLDNPTGKSSGVWGDNRGCEASGVAYESSRVGKEEGSQEASRVAENTRGYQQGVGRGG